MCYSSDKVYLLANLYCGVEMLKLAVIIILLLLGALVTKYLDEKSQQKILIGFGVLVAIAVVGLMVSELMR
ncbi:hypothetical protein C9I99_08030 [Photobacterium lutimaris]|uniref:Uncharacterized protein n=1 Tax=Photobacterium lutimaris TaxID=388278 RepID=A0A2T3J1Q2_9GAMM|nr:hypothetical protein C9I99_08030 [Photobacterium lutimaris]TDR77363.1 hypothetical protein DFP78_102380 [Photobacterium lutimaris]